MQIKICKAKMIKNWKQKNKKLLEAKKSCGRILSKTKSGAF